MTAYFFVPSAQPVPRKNPSTFSRVNKWHSFGFVLASRPKTAENWQAC